MHGHDGQAVVPGARAPGSPCRVVYDMGAGRCRMRVQWLCPQPSDVPWHRRSASIKLGSASYAAALLCSAPPWTAHRPGRGGPRRCAAELGGPAVRGDGLSGRLVFESEPARPRLARAYGRRLRHHCGTPKPPFQCTRIGGGAVAMWQWRRWRLASLPTLAAKCERHGPPFSASGSTVRHRCGS